MVRHAFRVLTDDKIKTRLIAFSDDRRGIDADARWMDWRIVDWVTAGPKAAWATPSRLPEAQWIV